MVDRDVQEFGLPSAIAMVFKRIENVDYKRNTFDFKMTWAMFIKLTGVPEKLLPGLRTHLKHNLKARINETDVSVVDDLKAIVKDVKSKDWSRG